MNYQNYQNLMLLTSSDTKRTLMHLFLFTTSAQRELVSICTQRIRNRNQLSLHYNLGLERIILGTGGGGRGGGGYVIKGTVNLNSN